MKILSRFTVLVLTAKKEKKTIKKKKNRKALNKLGKEANICNVTQRD